MRKTAIISFGCFLTACATTPSQTAGLMDETSDELRTACASELQDCRGAHTVRLMKEDGSIHEVSFDIDVPIVQGDDFVTIYPGETVYLEAETEGNEIVRLRAVPEVVNPGQTLSFTFSQSEGEAGMLLVAKNPFPRHLKYRAGMQLLDRDGLFSTSSCPVIAGGGAYESWPHPILLLVLTDFRLLPEGNASFVCE